MNIFQAWQKGYTGKNYWRISTRYLILKSVLSPGKGIVVSILDDGVQHNHPDLLENYVSQTFVDESILILN